MERRVIDLRSDTVTKPCSSMRQAMLTAAVGDDVYEEDPTVNALERMGADILGKEAALYVSSGTMGNLIAAMIHGRDRRSEVICGADSHVARDEVGGIASVAGVHTFQIPNRRDGGLELERLRDAVLADADIHYSIPRAVYLENTHGNFGGQVVSLEHVEEVQAVCRSRKSNYVALHCDGARLWNAAAVLGVTPAVAAKPFDTVTCCLSKGLGAPMGSLLAGPKDFVAEARWARKMLGGGMRQIGILAAAGIFALTHNLQNVHRDHDHAKQLVATITSKINGLAGVSIDVPQSNILFIRTDHAAKRDAVVDLCRSKGVLVGSWPNNAIRMVTHLELKSADVDCVSMVVSESLIKAFC